MIYRKYILGHSDEQNMFPRQLPPRSTVLEDDSEPQRRNRGLGINEGDFWTPPKGGAGGWRTKPVIRGLTPPYPPPPLGAGREWRLNPPMASDLVNHDDIMKPP